MNEKRFNNETEKIKGRERNNKGHNWIPERNVVTGFTFKGLLILFGIIALGIIICFLVN